MKILVTGAAGFIGSNLTRELLTKNHTVIGVDNLITSDGANLKELKKFPKFTFVKHDISKPFPQKLTTHHRQLTTIFHLACPTGVPNLVSMSYEMLLTSSIGTQHVLELAKKTKARLVFTSSSEVYGDPLVSPQTEDYTGNVNQIGIRSPYEEGKRFAESLIMMYVRKYNVRATIVRVFNTYGPGMSQNETRVIPRFIRLAVTGKPLTVHGNGNQIRTFCYIDDLISGLLLVAKKGKSGEVYNLGNDRETTIHDAAKLVLKLTESKSKIVLTPRPAHDHQRRQPSLSKIRKLGWSPQTTLTYGIKLTLETLAK